MKRNARNSCLEDTLSTSTQRAYRGDIDRFWVWAAASKGRERRRYPIPPSLLIDYLQDHIRGLDSGVIAKMAKRGVRAKGRPLAYATITRTIGALSVEHFSRNLPGPMESPAVRLAAIRAYRRAAVLRRKMKPLTEDVLTKLLATCSKDLRGVRDRAILLVGYAGGGRRRSELSRLRVEDLRRIEGGYLGVVQQHKTFIWTKEPLIFPILGQAASALEAWLAKAKITSGYVFRGIHRGGHIYKSMSPQLVCRMVKARCKSAGIPPKDYGAHSIRSGFMTQAVINGIPFAHIMLISGHRSITAATRYIRPVDPRNNGASWLGEFAAPNPLTSKSAMSDRNIGRDSPTFVSIPYGGKFKIAVPNL